MRGSSLHLLRLCVSPHFTFYASAYPHTCSFNHAAYFYCAHAPAASIAPRTSTVPSFVWTFLVLSALLCSLFSLGVCAIGPPIVLGSATWPFPCFPFYSFCGGLSCVSLPLAFSPALVCSPSSLLMVRVLCFMLWLDKGMSCMDFNYQLAPIP